MKHGYKTDIAKVKAIAALIKETRLRDIVDEFQFNLNQFRIEVILNKKEMKELKITETQVLNILKELFKDVDIRGEDDSIKIKPKEKPITPITTTSQTATSSATNETTGSAPEQSLERADLKIKILNGRGVAGTAADAKEFLTNLGWQITEIDNASSFDFEKTQIQIKESRLDFLGLLTKDLEGSYTIIEGEKLSETESFDALITIGKE